MAVTENQGFTHYSRYWIDSNCLRKLFVPDDLLNYIFYSLTSISFFIKNVKQIKTTTKSNKR